MNANDMTVGIEIEMNLPLAMQRQITVGSYARGIQILGLPAGWVAKQDCSVHAAAGFFGVEVVSPVLQGENGMAQIVAVVQQLKAWGGTVNSSCGFHVHVGFDRSQIADLQRLVHLVANHEKAIFASTGTKNREQGNFCKSIKARLAGVEVSRETMWSGFANHHDRYYILNLHNIVSGAKPTVEFRAFAGTLNLTKITSYVRLCLALVEKAAHTLRRAPWVAKTPVESSPIARSGEGQTEMARLFYALGWTKGREAYTYGNVTAVGAPDIEANKRILMKMARKYDGLLSPAASAQLGADSQ